MSTDALCDADEFEAFYRHYLELHDSPRTRAAHALGTASACVLVGASIATRRPVLALLAPVVDYAIAQTSHRIDGTKTEPWRRPTWHLRAELRLFRGTVTQWARFAKGVGRPPHGAKPC